MCEDIDFIFMIDADQITKYMHFFFFPPFTTIKIEGYQKYSKNYSLQLQMIGITKESTMISKTDHFQM